MAFVAIFVVISILLLSTTATFSTLTPAPAPASAYVNLTDLLAHAGPYRTFLTHLEDTQTIQTFQERANDTQNEGITIFAPTDSAFASLTNPSLSNLTEDQLGSLLRFHALPKYYTLTDLSKNLTGSTVTTLAGGEFTVTITDSSGTIGINSSWTQTNITSSVHAAVPTAVYQINRVLIPEAIFGATPPVSPSPPQSPAPISPPSGPIGSTGLTGSSDDAPTPQPSGSKGDSSSSSRTSIGALTCYFALVIASSLMLM